CAALQPDPLQRDWFKLELCVADGGTITCPEHTGACCDGATGVCQDNVPSSQCPAPGAVATGNEKEACGACGPGDGFVDEPNCLGVEKIANTGAVVGLDLNLDGDVDTNLVLEPCQDPPANKLLVIEVTDNTAAGKIDTEILAMCLTVDDVTLTAGSDFGLEPSTGAIVQRAAPDEDLADSFFGVFVKVEGGVLSQPVYNHDPLPVEAVIYCIPPSAAYVHVITVPIPLYLEPPGTPPGYPVAQLVTANHSVNKRPDNQYRWEKGMPCAELVPPCEEHTGACCDKSQPGGVCVSDVPQSECPVDPSDPFNQVQWYKFEACVEDGGTIDCREHTGACCYHDEPGGFCKNDVYESQCPVGSQVDWHKFTPCSAIICEEHSGACCDRETGMCTDDVFAQDCQGGKLVWYKDTPCSAVNCLPKFPAVSKWGMIIVCLLLLATGKIYFGRRSPVADHGRG
ncbi:MAG: hypothetical protein JSU86_05740, partial [Phycisphaerales bacterium]